ncbi:exo-beta-N-acetylmuramidase NamZ domain-containing protein [Desulfosarcina sp.]|uniref:exo-beta-N-acetylmuramidase NamZ family protein n=1 Tax=Desulfosarcina sp. TaxID=2027861 RepID=UPI003567407D
MTAVKTGLDNLCESPPPSLKHQRIGLLCNPASVDSRYRHARERIRQAFPGQLKALYSPQHGFYAERQDNMIESADRLDPVTGLPVFSLYGDTRIPSRAMMDPIDVMLVDLQDVGTRVYTFIYTLSHCMEAARQYDKKIIVLDRPNPLGGRLVEGNLLAPSCSSFVGRYPIPMRHGLTIGELAILFNTRFGIGCDLAVVPMQGWKRAMTFSQTGVPWVAPSPNLPTPASAMVYPGQVIWEGTNISEGRGTTLPFELFGAPFLAPDRLMEDIDTRLLGGAVLRPVEFEPTSNKWEGHPCKGFQIHVTDPALYSPYALSLAFYQVIYQTYPDRFAYKQPPYEYEYERLPMDLILGDRQIRSQIETGTPLATMISGWEAPLAAYQELVETVHLYK